MLVFPAVAAVSVFLYFTFYTVFLTEYSSMGYYSHFLIAGAFLLIAYSMLLKLRYSRVDSLVLSILTVLAVDELWQTPYNVLNWTASLLGAEVGLATGALSLMSIPLLFYFVLIAKGKIRLGYDAKVWLLISLSFTLAETAATLYPVPFVASNPYPLVLPWFLFFLYVFVSSSISNST